MIVVNNDSGFGAFGRPKTSILSTDVTHYRILRPSCHSNFGRPHLNSQVFLSLLCGLGGGGADNNRKTLILEF